MHLTSASTAYEAPLLSLEVGCGSAGPAGDTSLIIAIRHNNHRLAHHLVNQGASVNQTSKSGLSPLAVAKQQKNPELVTFLLKNGASE